MTEFLCLALIETLHPPGRANIRFQLALDGVSTKIDRAMKPSRFKQAFRILQPLDRRLPKNRRLDNSRPDPSTHASLQAQFLERGTGFEPATIALEERDSTVELPPPGLSTQITGGLVTLPTARTRNLWSLGPGLNR
jgi:hypothetical protein